MIRNILYSNTTLIILLFSMVSVFVGTMFSMVYGAAKRQKQTQK